MLLEDKFGRFVRLTEERELHIKRRKEMADQIVKINETLEDPEVVRRSQQDPAVHLYYKRYSQSPVSNKYLAVIVKVEVQSPFVITAFYTDRIKQGKQIWPSSS